ncbi:hypothetical protein ECC02_010748 [Trypanosoma cruzi]|uniref:Uncharacterized protein n=1 Tax=Trypanosoma cruzi TaxID=5693 RepID=A0A7J6XR52_TRYCR|nr:hypothetical protein ECC02_010748 [Trypanosoma cruzi]
MRCRQSFCCCLLQRSRSATGTHHPAQPEDPPSTDPQHGRNLGTCSCRKGSNPHSSQAPSTPTPPTCLHAAKFTPATRRQDTSRSPVLPSRKGSRRQNSVLPCVLNDHTPPQRVRHRVCVCACACVFGSAYNCRAAVRHKRVRRKQRQREADSTHAQITHIITHKHTRSPRNGCSQPQNNEKQNKKPKRGTTSAHTLIAPVKQNTHTGRERERGRPLNAIKTKQKQLRCSAHAARQDGSGACRAKESTNGPAWVCMQYIQWAHYVCASWDEVRARVHARGHTQGVSERRVCVRAVHGSLSLTLTRPPQQKQQPHTQQKEEAKEGRWCGRSRCCCHCHRHFYLPFYLYQGRSFLSWFLRHCRWVVHVAGLLL